MLQQRLITAIVLLAILLPALAAQSPWPFGVVTLALIAAAGWEWARLNTVVGLAAWLFGAAVALGALLAWRLGAVTQPPTWLWTAGLLVWVLAGAQALRAGVPGWGRWPVVLRMVAGLLMLWLAWLAIAVAWARGLNFLLSVFCLVWVADVAAYFGGRAFGRRKLAPAISPGKSWEGVYTGMVGVLLLALGWILFDRYGQPASPSLYSLLLQRWGLAGLGVSCLFLAAMSVVGDLFESLVKRSAGAKDSSQLLPGHGGVLDRIDALLPVCPLALALVSA
jgi:phosphatidate cytidylyltransferase